MKKENNLFDFATKELSQDAFIAWLVNWINVQESTDEELKAMQSVARKFLQEILAQESVEEKLGQRIIAANIKELQDLILQYKGIDVFITFKYEQQEYAIIIEDKKLTSEHHRQIENYENKIKKEKQDTNVITVYYKMIDEHSIESNVDAVITRERMLKVLKSYKGNNNIIKDYINYLYNIEKRIKLNELSGENWIYKETFLGFATEHYNNNKNKLDNNVKIGNRQGLYYYDWYFRKIADYWLYLFIDWREGLQFLGIGCKQAEGKGLPLVNERKKIFKQVKKHLEKSLPEIVILERKSFSEKAEGSALILKIDIKELNKDKLKYLMKKMEKCLEKL